MPRSLRAAISWRSGHGSDAPRQWMRLATAWSRRYVVVTPHAVYRAGTDLFETGTGVRRNPEVFGHGSVPTMERNTKKLSARRPAKSPAKRACSGSPTRSVSQQRDERLTGGPHVGSPDSDLREAWAGGREPDLVFSDVP